MTRPTYRDLDKQIRGALHTAQLERNSPRATLIALELATQTAREMLRRESRFLVDEQAGVIFTSNGETLDVATMERVED